MNTKDSKWINKILTKRCIDMENSMSMLKEKS